MHYFYAVDQFVFLLLAMSFAFCRGLRLEAIDGAQRSVDALFFLALPRVLIQAARLVFILWHIAAHGSGGDLPPNSVSLRVAWLYVALQVTRPPSAMDFHVQLRRFAFSLGYVLFVLPQFIFEPSHWLVQPTVSDTSLWCLCMAFVYLSYREVRKAGFSVPEIVVAAAVCGAAAALFLLAWFPLFDVMSSMFPSKADTQVAINAAVALHSMFSSVILLLIPLLLFARFSSTVVAMDRVFSIAAWLTCWWLLACKCSPTIHKHPLSGAVWVGLLEAGGMLLHERWQRLRNCFTADRNTLKELLLYVAITDVPSAWSRVRMNAFEKADLLALRDWRQLDQAIDHLKSLFPR